MAQSLARPAGPPSLLRRLLPEGTGLPVAEWRSRHRALLVAVWVLDLVVLGWAATARGVPAGLALAAPGAGLGLLAPLLQRIRPRTSRELASCAVTVALLVEVAMVVHLSGGRTESHFLFFAVVAAATLYQTWAPFLAAVAFVLFHHGVVGSLAPSVVFDAGDLPARPWLVAVVHAGLLALAAGVSITAWRLDERVRGRLADLASRSRLVLDTVGDAVVAMDASGTVLHANPAAARLFGRDPSGEPLAALLGEDAATTREDGWARVSLPSGTAVDVTVRRTGGGPVAAVATLRDRTSRERAVRAEARLATLAEQEAERRRAVEALQAAVRPDPVDVPGLSLGVTYVPAQEGPAGGDHYDWLVLPDGTLQIAVVDAMGRGVGATRQALAVTSVVRTLALEGCALGDLLGRAAGLLEIADPDLVATALVARLRPATGELTLAGAGHPPAMLVRRDGAVRELEAPGLPIGYPGGGSDAVVSVRLDGGDALLLYTDGLIEGTRDVVAGLQCLASAAAGLARGPLTPTTERLIRELPTTGCGQDDCLALALRRDTVPRPRMPAQAPFLDLGLLAPEPVTVPAVRRAVRRAVETLGADEAAADAAALLVTELASNAVRHARTRYEVHVVPEGDQVRVEVRDADPQLPSLRRPGLTATSGRGLGLVAATASEWGVELLERAGKSVWFALPLRTTGAEKPDAADDPVLAAFSGLDLGIDDLVRDLTL